MDAESDLREHLSDILKDEAIFAKVVKLTELATMRRQFDEAFYRENNSDSNFAEIEPITHFDIVGWQEGRDPAPWFSVDDYLSSNEDVRNSGINPFLHYIVHGVKEGRRIAKSRLRVVAPTTAMSLVTGKEVVSVKRIALPVVGLFAEPSAPTLANAALSPRVALSDIQVEKFEELLRAKIVATPEEALQQYARSFPAFMAANASRRYVALERQMAMAQRILARQAAGSDRLSLEAYVAQLSVVHRQVQTGPLERPRRPAPLKALRYEEPEVSIIIPVHNKFWITYNCIAALLLSPNDTTFEIIIVDDCSDDLTVNLPEIVKNLIYIRNESNIGFVKSANKGAEFARGRYVVMLNNDTEPGPCWIDELLFVFRNFSDVGLVGAKLVYPNGKLQEAGCVAFPNLDIWNYGRNQSPHEPRFNYTRQVHYASGACIMVSTEVWRRLSGFDEIFSPAYYEDTDLAFRIRAAGLKTYFSPFAEVVHFEGASNGVSTDTGVKRYQATNEPKFRQRWGNLIRQFPHSDPELAKDHGVTLRALVIDYKTPEPDTDAGSYAAIQEMRLLQALGFKLTFIAQNLSYMGNYTEELQRRGVECLYAPYQSSVEDVIEQRGLEFDIVYITRYNVAQHYIAAIRSFAPRAKIIFCNADLHFLREIRAAIVSNNPVGLEAALATREAELAVMRQVDVTLSYTDAEASVILSHNLDRSKVARCPWVVEVSDNSPSFSERAGIAFLGSFRHPPNEEAVLFFVTKIMPSLRNAISGIKLHIYGSHMGTSIRRLASQDIIVEGFAENVEEVYDRHRVFIAPLLSGAGLKGKVVGALAAGIPTAMTTLAAEGIGVSRTSEALVVDTVDEWVKAIVLLNSNEARWLEMSARAKIFARENFSFERGVKTMRAALSTGGVCVG